MFDFKDIFVDFYLYNYIKSQIQKDYQKQYFKRKAGLGIAQQLFESLFFAWKNQCEVVVICKKNESKKYVLQLFHRIGNEKQTNQTNLITHFEGKPF